ncbi:MAG: DUF4377 domain-containing protein, partial [Candidatus Promineifilaceae bacterium]
MKQRYLVILMIGVLTVFAVSACTSEESGSDAEVAESDTSQEEQTEDTAPAVEGVEKQIQVGPVLVDCVGEGPQECILIREHKMDPWEYWYQSIDGFEYEEGFLYDLLIEEQTVENPPAGGSSIKWVLKEELSIIPVTISTLIVGPEQVECEGEGPQLCYQVKSDPDAGWQFFYSEIEGFQFEPGYEYELLVAEIPVQNPPAGASSIQYLLLKEVSKTPAEMAEEEQENVTGTIWAATTINSKPVLEGSEVLLGIAPGRIGGMSGCNTYFGPVEVDRNKVSVGPLSSTRMACAENIIEQEGYYLTALESAATVDVEG